MIFLVHQCDVRGCQGNLVNDGNFDNNMEWIMAKESGYYRKIHCLTSEFHVKFHAKNRYRTNREAMSAISVFQVKFNVEFTSQAVNFS